jgi:hypothetical protein
MNTRLNRTASRKDAWLALTLAVPSLVVLAAHAYLGSMSRFLADDYCVAYYANRFGFLRSIWYWYINWSGGFSTSMADWLLVLIRAYGMPFVVPAVIALWLAIAVFAIHHFLPRESSPALRITSAITLSATTVFATLLVSPNVPQSLYWWTGMRAYTLPLIISTLYAGLFQWLYRSDKSRNSFLWSAIGFGIIFINGGFSETFTPVQLIFFVSVVALTLWTNKLNRRERPFRFLAAGMLGSIASLIVMVAAPGNAVRQKYYKAPPGMFEVVKIGLDAFLKFLGSLLASPLIVVSLIGILAAAIWIGSRFRPGIQVKIWMPAAILAVGLGFAFGCFLPAAWGLSSAPPSRSLIIPAFFLAASWITVGFLSGAWLNPPPLSNPRLGLLILAFLLLGFSSWSSASYLYSTRKAYIDYASKWTTIDRQIIQTRQAGDTSVHIPSMNNWASLNMPNDNPKFWLNQCYSKYYGVQVLSPDEEFSTTVAINHPPSKSCSSRGRKVIKVNWHDRLRAQPPASHRHPAARRFDKPSACRITDRRLPGLSIPSTPPGFV